MAAFASRCGWRLTSTRRHRTARRCTSTSLAAIALLVGCGEAQRDVPYVDLTVRTGALEFTRITRQLFRNREALVDILERSNPGAEIRLPPIDFAHREVYLVAAGPRSSTGYHLRIVRVRDDGDRVVVFVREDTPSLGEPVQARVTYPYVLISLPRNDKPVKLKWLGRP